MKGFGGCQGVGMIMVGLVSWLVRWSTGPLVHSEPSPSAHHAETSLEVFLEVGERLVR